MIQLISMVVGFVVALVVAFLTHRRPEKSWEWISTGGIYLLMIVGVMFAQYERSLRSPMKDYVHVCSNGAMYEPDSLPLLIWLDDNTDCRLVRKPPERSLGGEVLDWVKDTLVSAWLDIPADVLGLIAGIYLAGGKPPKLRDELRKLWNEGKNPT